MSLAEKLKKVQLKQTETKDSSKPDITAKEYDENEIKIYQNKVLDINIEEWLDLIPEFTFKTKLFPLKYEDAELFFQAYELKMKENKELTENIKNQIEKLAENLQKVINEIKQDDPQVFVKSSSRSAKDTGPYQQKFIMEYQAKLKAKKLRDDNDKMISLLEAGYEMLKVKSAKELLMNWVFSERIYQDMFIAIKHKSRFKENFVIRKWVDMDPDMEFRGFVSNGKLTALSQYNHLCFWPRLVQMKSYLEKIIVDYFYSNIQKKLESNFKNYIIDFCVVGEKLDQIWVIELNPFLSTTDGCLFSWENEKSLIENGPFEFRINSKIRSGGKSLMQTSWREIFEKYSNIDNEEDEKKK